ncbi:MAG: indolepyruvate ferredoxin oxidoreductase family protein [Alphaproteobacteria bacterium]|nr:indolepyruvate ferredoxin oxidoreductase family protein [Alphaproteobacteria bacterium]
MNALTHGLNQVSLEDKYRLEQGRIFVTGVQALVRLPMLQKTRDRAAGLDTAGFISGYRGSPLGGYDQQLWRAKRHLEAHDIHFQPGLNEDLAATSIWGTQQIGLFPGAKKDGVFSIWYGKGPGVDRSGDVFKHGTQAGTARHGGVLTLLGDDHTAKSSTLAHQSEYACVDAMIPVMNPSGVQELLDYGLYAFAMGRYAGLWTAMKCVADTMDASASIEIDPDRLVFSDPTDFEMPAGGLHIRWPDTFLAQEERLHRYKLAAAQAFARANPLDRTVFDSADRRLGIVTTGKSYLDVRQALDEIGLDADACARIGLSVYKVGIPWPLEPRGLRRFAEGLDEILVVEEKRPLMEGQIKEALYDLPTERRPRVVGKYDEEGNWILPSTAELYPEQVAKVISQRLRRLSLPEDVAAAVDRYSNQPPGPQSQSVGFARTPYFCSGCPHNSSTKVPEGSRALAGIGCHFMTLWMDRETETFTQMGGEGTPWIGQAPFVEDDHVFVNIGDGTYTHSGALAIRAAIASGVNITYKILYNDAVAMTGGQPADGLFTPLDIARQMKAEGAKAVRIVSEKPETYPTSLDAGITVDHRDELDRVQRDLREIKGTTVLIYDQTCAAEKRRRRKRGQLEDPNKRIFINEQVCEGCGDCSAQSNCVSILPVETEFGRKRAIDQSSCNKDYSCTKGFCPSFVGVIGGKPRKAKAAGDGPFPVLPEPTLPSVDRPYGILVGGIGGTGVVTIGALMGMAAHLEGKGVTILDQTGLAQKGGTVLSHVRIADKPENIHTNTLPQGGVDLLLGCDLVVAAGDDSLRIISPERTRAVINTQEVMTGAFVLNPNVQFPAQRLKDALDRAVGGDAVTYVDASKLATAALGDSIAANLFMLGFAWQKGLVPLTEEAILKAIEINGVAVPFNRQAFLWGRRAAHNPDLTRDRLTPSTTEAPRHRQMSESLDETIDRRAAILVDYQDKAYAERYRAVVEKVRVAEAKRRPGSQALTEAVARYLFKLMAYKDEYEVARLYSDPTFLRQLDRQFEGDYTLEFHLAPPLIAPKDPETGRLKKMRFGPWMLRVFGLLAKMKGLRGTRWDPFGRTEERRMERRLIEDYIDQLDRLLPAVTAENFDSLVAIARIPEDIRGYGHVKERHVKAARTREALLVDRFHNPDAPALAAD